VCRRAFETSFYEADLSKAAVSIAQYRGRVQRSVSRSSSGVHQALRESDPVSDSMTGEFIPSSARVFNSNPMAVKDGLWKTKASKSCSPVSGRTLKGNQSAT
jgi:hypothetical protein